MAGALIDEVAVVAVPLRQRFRGIEVREAMLLRRGEQWAEWSPFVEYDDAEAANWLRAALEDAEPVLLRDHVEVNVTVPVVPADAAAALVAASGCRTAKVKVADPRSDPAEDLTRLRAVRDALGPGGQLRVDANGAWSVDQAERLLSEWAWLGLQYAEQPCAEVTELAELRRRLRAAGVGVPIAADESIRRATDPQRVAELDAADVVVLKHQPLGGSARCVQLGAELGLPVVLSSALETSIGIWAGLRTACAVAGPELACGLNTVALLADDVVAEPLLARDGYLELGARPVPDAAALARLQAAPDRQQWWSDRLRRCLALLSAGEEDK